MAVTTDKSQTEQVGTAAPRGAPTTRLIYAVVAAGAVAIALVGLSVLLSGVEEPVQPAVPQVSADMRAFSNAAQSQAQTSAPGSIDIVQSADMRAFSKASVSVTSRETADIRAFATAVRDQAQIEASSAVTGTESADMRAFGKATGSVTSPETADTRAFASSIERRLQSADSG